MEKVSRDYCLFCDEPVRRGPPDYLEWCPNHGTLEGFSDREWARYAQDREGKPLGGYIDGKGWPHPGEPPQQ